MLVSVAEVQASTSKLNRACLAGAQSRFTHGMQCLQNSPASDPCYDLQLPLIPWQLDDALAMPLTEQQAPLLLAGLTHTNSIFCHKP